MPSTVRPASHALRIIADLVIARIRQFFDYLIEAFWLLPALLVAAGVLGAMALASADADPGRPGWIVDSAWLFNGDAASARTLLGALASATLAAAGTLFSVTIAALSLAAGQMGPHLLRNFTHDRGNQCTLGVFLATFAYALVLLHRTGPAGDDGEIARLSLTTALLLALLCVGMLIYFVGHMAGRINVETVVTLVGNDMQSAIRRLTHTHAQPLPPPDACWHGAAPIRSAKRGYLHNVDSDGLADWAAKRGAAVRLLVRPGDYVFPNAVVAFVQPDTKGADQAVQNALALDADRHSTEDLEYAVRELVEVAVRALSPAINSPLAAIGVLDRLGAGLCILAGRTLPTGVTLRAGRAALVMPGFAYDGLVNTMFNMIRQYGSTSPAVLIRMLEVLAAAAGVETEPDRIASLARHADLVLADAERGRFTPGDTEDVRRCHRRFDDVRRHGVAPRLNGSKC